MKCLLGFVFMIWLLPGYSTGIHVGPGQTYKTIYGIKAVHPGDTIYMHSGVYTDAGQVFDSLIGTASKWITIRPYQNDSVSIHVQYTFQHAQYLKVTGLHFYGNDPAQYGKYFHLLFFDYSYACYTSIHNIIVDNCSFTDHNVPVALGNTAASLKITGTDTFEVVNCLFKNCTNVADGVSMNADRFGLIKNCRFENIDGNGSHCKGGSHNIRYEQNLFINCIASAINIGGATGSQFFCPANNATFEADSIMVYSNITIGGTVGFDFITCNHSYVVNNTCYKSTSFAFRCLNENNIYPFGNDYCYNNIFAPYSVNGIYMNAGGLTDFSTFYFKNNLFHDFKNTDPSSISWNELPNAHISGSIIDDPMFKDTAGRDFSLLKGSPAIGKGLSVSNPLSDYHTIAFATSRSIGALEYAGNTVINNYEEASNISIFPNPAHGIFNISWMGAGSIRFIEVYNSKGQLVYSGKQSGYFIKLDISRHAKGLYRVVMETNTSVRYSQNIIAE